MSPPSLSDFVHRVTVSLCAVLKTPPRDPLATTVPGETALCGAARAPVPVAPRTAGPGVAPARRCRTYRLSVSHSSFSDSSFYDALPARASSRIAIGKSDPDHAILSHARRIAGGRPSHQHRKSCRPTPCTQHTSRGVRPAIADAFLAARRMCDVFSRRSLRSIRRSQAARRSAPQKQPLARLDV